MSKPTTYFGLKPQPAGVRIVSLLVPHLAMEYKPNIPVNDEEGRRVGSVRSVQHYYGGGDGANTVMSVAFDVCPKCKPTHGLRWLLWWRRRHKKACYIARAWDQLHSGRLNGWSMSGHVVPRSQP